MSVRPFLEAAATLTRTATAILQVSMQTAAGVETLPQLELTLTRHVRRFGQATCVFLRVLTFFLGGLWSWS